MATSPLTAQRTTALDQHAGADRGASDRRAVAGINGFSLDLYKQSATTAANVFLSPLSASIAIGLAYRGARGATAAQLRAALHFDASPTAYLASDAAVLRSLNRTEGPDGLRVAGALWVQRDLPLRPDFAADFATHVPHGLQRVDFRHDLDAARAAINRRVAEATDDRIRDLLHVGDVDERTRIALVDSIHWKAKWAAPFDTAETTTAPFHTLAGRSVAASLMHRQGDYQVVERGGAKAIQLPYAIDGVSLVVVLPSKASGLPDLERGLTAAILTRWLAELDAGSPRDTVLTLPKMHLAWRADIVPDLRSLGATTPFGDEADFSGIAEEPSPGEVPGAVGLKIGKVIQQTFLDVDEEGSEAAAATAVISDVVVSGLLRHAPSRPPFVFRADRPFLFLLRDRRSGAVLFIGRYVEPRPTGASTEGKSG